jgi:hypothetical protein
MSHSLTLVKPLIEQSTEFVVVSRWTRSMRGFDDGGYSYEEFATREEAERVFRDYEAGEYPRARAVCLFASRLGVPIGRIL